MQHRVHDKDVQDINEKGGYVVCLRTNSVVNTGCIFIIIIITIIVIIDCVCVCVCLCERVSNEQKIQKRI